MQIKTTRRLCYTPTTMVKVKKSKMSNITYDHVIPLLCVHPIEIKSCVHKVNFTRMFIAAKNKAQQDIHQQEHG